MIVYLKTSQIQVHNNLIVIFRIIQNVSFTRSFPLLEVLFIKLLRPMLVAKEQ